MEVAMLPNTVDQRDRSAACERLLDVAESLFAQRGVAETSVRTITAAAGMNVAAVNYYFASKDHLFDAVIDRRLPALVAAREAALSQADGRVESILRAWIEPSLQVGFAHPEFVRLASRLRFEDDPSRWQGYRGRQADVIARFLAALRQALPDLDPVEVERRFHLVFGVVSHVWAHLPPKTGESAETITNRLVTFLTAGMYAPAP